MAPRAWSTRCACALERDRPLSRMRCCGNAWVDWNVNGVMTANGSYPDWTLKRQQCWKCIGEKWWTAVWMMSHLCLLVFKICFAFLVFDRLFLGAHEFWRTNFPRRVAGATDTLSHLWGMADWCFLLTPFLVGSLVVLCGFAQSKCCSDKISNVLRQWIMLYLKAANMCEVVRCYDRTCSVHPCAFYSLYLRVCCTPCSDPVLC